MNLSTKLFDLTIKNPIMPASGPLTGDLEKMIYLQNLGLGVMVTKTISTKAAEVIRPCIYGDKNFIINNELWSEYPPEAWVNDFLPKLKAESDIPLIVSVGYSKEDMKELIPKLDQFADIFEVSTHYVGKDLSVIADTVKTIRSLTKKPILMKMSPHINCPVEFAKMVLENGGNGVVSMNSLGPTMKIDISKRKAIIGDKNGHAWMSGPAIKPVSLAFVNMIKENVPECVVIATGGIKTAEDVIEFLLAGADAVQLLSSALLFGKDIYKKIIDDLPQVLKANGYESIEDVKATTLTKGEKSYAPTYPIVNESKCTGCKICENVCPYFAMKVNNVAAADTNSCFGCGLCESKCPVKAIGGVL